MEKKRRLRKSVAAQKNYSKPDLRSWFWYLSNLIYCGSYDYTINLHERVERYYDDDINLHGGIKVTVMSGMQGQVDQDVFPERCHFGFSFSQVESVRIV